MSEQAAYDERIERIARAVEDLTTTDVLFGEAEFLQVYENPAGKAELALGVYQNELTPQLQKEIAGYSMQRLPIEELAWLIAQVGRLVEKDELDPRLLETLAFPALNWGARMQTDYDQPLVRRLLEKLAVFDKLSPKRRIYIRDKVLTGKARADVLDLREAGQIP